MAKRTNFYIDGYNLYCGIKEQSLYPYIWLNLHELCTALLSRSHREQLKSIKYFTAIPEKFDAPRAKRHQTYLRALATLPSLQIIEGDFKKSKLTCTKCFRQFKRWEEKRTDVAIAATLVEDLYLDEFDSAYVISADSDLIPALKTVDKYFPKKRIGVWFPPGRIIGEIDSDRMFSMTIPDRLIQTCQFPDPQFDTRGRPIHKPKKWNFSLETRRSKRKLNSSQVQRIVYAGIVGIVIGFLLSKLIW